MPGRLRGLVLVVSEQHMLGRLFRGGVLPQAVDGLDQFGVLGPGQLQVERVALDEMDAVPGPLDHARVVGDARRVAGVECGVALYQHGSLEDLWGLDVVEVVPRYGLPGLGQVVGRPERV